MLSLVGSLGGDGEWGLRMLLLNGVRGVRRWREGEFKNFGSVGLSGVV